MSGDKAAYANERWWLDTIVALSFARLDDAEHEALTAKDSIKTLNECSVMGNFAPMDQGF